LIGVAPGRTVARVTTELMLLAAVVGLAFTVEASLGFGATVVTVALGALWFPVDVLLPAFVPMNVAMSAWLAFRNRRHVRWDYLGRRVVPFMALGLPAGLLAFAHLPSAQLKQAFGVFVVLLSAVELVRMRLPAAAPAAMAPVAERLMLVAGGVVHGAFATGGPLAVYVSGRVLDGKSQFRATLSVLWLVLNTVLVATYLVKGDIGAKSLGLAAVLVPSLFAGLAAGEWLHHRISMRAFRVIVFALLLVVGLVLVARG
jgi:uncharacterized protein